MDRKKIVYYCIASVIVLTFAVMFVLGGVYFLSVAESFYPPVMGVVVANICFITATIAVLALAYWWIFEFENKGDKE